MGFQKASSKLFIAGHMMSCLVVFAFFNPKPALSADPSSPGSTMLQRGAATHHLKDIQELGLTWIKNWSPTPAPLPNNVGAPFYYVENVPMMYAPSQVDSLVSGQLTLGGRSDYILGFNEPDLQQIDPAIAAESWHKLSEWVDKVNREQGKKYKLVAPAPSHLSLRPEWADSKGSEFKRRDWLQEMYDRHVQKFGHPPKFDALAAHCYEFPQAPTKPSTFCREVITYFEEKVMKWNIPDGIWLTEYAFPNPCNYSCQTEPIANCDDPYFTWYVGECQCKLQLLKDDQGGYASLCGNTVANCSCITKTPGQRLCKTSVDGSEYYQKDCSNPWPVHGFTPECTCEEVTQPTPVCYVNIGCEKRVFCKQDCDFSPSVYMMNEFHEWLQSRPLMRRFAWFIPRLRGTEASSPWMSFTTRLVGCGENVLEDGCEQGILTPLGEAYAELNMGYRSIQSNETGKCLDVGLNEWNVKAAYLWDCYFGKPQLFSIRNQFDGLGGFVIKSVESEECFDVGLAQWKVNPYLFSCWGGRPQRFRWWNNRVGVIESLERPGECFDLGLKEWGVKRPYLYHCYGGRPQQFTIIPK